MKAGFLAVVVLLFAPNVLGSGPHFSEENFVVFTSKEVHNWTFTIGETRFGIEVREAQYSWSTEGPVASRKTGSDRLLYLIHPITNVEKDRFFYVTIKTVRMAIAIFLSLIGLLVIWRMRVARKKAGLSNEQG